MNGLGRIDPRLTGLSHPAAARAAPFLAEGGRHWIRGLQTRAGFAIGRDTDVLASVDLPGLGTAASVLLFPGVVRRDFPSTHGSCVETLLASPGLPFVVAEWRVGAGRLPGRIVVELTGPGGEIVKEGPATIVIARGEGRVGLSISPDPDSRSVDGGGPDPLRVVIEPGHSTLEGEDAGLVSMALAFGDPEEVRRGLMAARHADAHAVRAASGPEDGLRVRTGVPDIDDRVRWLRSRLAGQIRRSVTDEGVAERTRCDLGLAALGAGDRESAELLVSEDPTASVYRTLLAARLASVFGDTRAAGAAARAWTSDPTTVDATPALARLALEELAEALHGAADVGTLSALRAMAGLRTDAEGAVVTGAGHGSPERRLPMARSATASADGAADWLTGLVHGDPAPSAPPGERSPRARAAILDARAAAGSFATDPDEAWVRWRRLLSDPPESGSSSVLWDPDRLSARVGGGSLTAELLIALAYGLLGVRPDAAAGRIRLAPRMPSHLRRFEAAGIRVGTSSLRLRYTKSEALQRYELSPEIASVPPLVVLEPSVAGRVLAVRVDGESADLDRRTTGERTVTPVQLPLDGDRTLEVETTPTGAARR